MRKTDGTEAEVHVGKDFAVTSVDTRPAGGPGGPGHGGPGGARLDTAALAKTLGVTEDKLQAALAKVRPAKGDRDAKRTEWTAAIAKALGQSAADVQAVLDANRPAPPAGGAAPQQRPAKPDDSALAKALATKFGISQDKAQAALDAAHGDKGDRGDEMAAALAKELGLDTAKVKVGARGAAARPPVARAGCGSEEQQPTLGALTGRLPVNAPGTVNETATNGAMSATAPLRRVDTPKSSPAADAIWCRDRFRCAR